MKHGFDGWIVAGSSEYNNELIEAGAHFKAQKGMDVINKVIELLSK